MQNIPKSVVIKIRNSIADKYGLPFLKKISMHRVCMLRLNKLRSNDPEYKKKWAKRHTEGQRNKKMTKKGLEKMRIVAYNIQFSEGFKNRSMEYAKTDKFKNHLRRIRKLRNNSNSFYNSFDDEPEVKVINDAPRPNDFAGVVTMNDYAEM